MVYYFIYAKDYSASTDGVNFYHTNGLKTVEQFKNDVWKFHEKLTQSNESSTESRIIYLHWGHKCTEESEDTIIESYQERIGEGDDTRPETIIQWIKKRIGNVHDVKIELLYIITDGLINRDSMEKCKELNSDMQYNNVVFYAFNQNLNHIDLSVAATFLKSHCAIHRNYELLDDVNISEEFDYSKIRVSNFIAGRDNLKSYIKLKYINKFKEDALALQEIDKLKMLRNRLFEELSKSEQHKANLDTKDKNEFMREFINTVWYQNLNASEHGIKVEIEKSISTLINYIVSDNKSYSFDALKFESKFNNSIEEEPIVDAYFATEQEIEFPDIILDDDKGIPVILLTEFNLLDKIIFHRTDAWAEVSPASFSKFKSAMECPLFLLNDPDISESIGYFYTLNVYKQLLENTTKTEPRTRRPYHGGLVLTDTNEFDKYNDYILSATYFAFKKINYNVGLFYYILWKNCENKEWMDRNVLEQFKKYVMRRISATVCKIGLSSLPLDPQENTSLLTALWYCVELSSCIFKDDPQNFMHERLRMYYGVAHCMIEILRYFNYDLDLESIENRRDIIRHVMILKKIPSHRERVYYMLDKIFKNINGFLVCEIEKPANLQKLNYLKLNHKGMLHTDIIQEKVHLNEYVHLINYEDDSNKNGKIIVKICEKTFRPFFTIDQETSFYSELVKITKKVVINNDDDKDNVKISYDTIDSLEFDKILSSFNLFLRCVEDSKKYPTLPEYLEYVLSKKKFNGDLVTIFPPNVYVGLEDVYSQYRNVIETVDVNKLIEVFKSYVKRVKRVKEEGVLKFNDDNAINKFITSEELKVNLIKKV
ncbi:GSCOCG00009751001-RA-CDS [Cotesia congregata]|nr:GSCOCG00009751001-RA-CDS [Cotesia congregata]